MMKWRTFCRVPFKLESVKYAEGNIKESQESTTPRYEVDS